MNKIKKPPFLLEMPPIKKDLKNFEITPEQWVEAVEFYHKHRDELINTAIISRDKGVSYRNFLVGCVAIGIEPNLPDGEYGVYNSANFTFAPGKRSGSEKRCAERNTLDGAKKFAKVVFAIVIVSKERDTGNQEQVQDILHPCKDCRLMLRELVQEGLLRDDTILCSANDSDEKNIIIEERTLRELLDLYLDDVK